MTVGGDSQTMRKLAAVLVASLVLPAVAVAGGPPPPPFPKLPGKWSHAEINVRIKRQYHTLILDYGRITQVSPGQMTLRERDGSTVVIPLSAQTLVVIDKLAAVPGDLKKRMNVQVMRIDGGAAVRVRATS